MSDGPEITPILRWLSKLAGLLAIMSAVLAGVVGYRLFETQARLEQLSRECGPCCDAQAQSVDGGPASAAARAEGAN